MLGMILSENCGDICPFRSCCCGKDKAPGIAPFKREKSGCEACCEISPCVSREIVAMLFACDGAEDEKNTGEMTCAACQVASELDSSLGFGGSDWYNCEVWA